MLKEAKLIDGSVKRARSLRRRFTATEYLLWRRLRNRLFYNLKFRRQAPIGPYIVDFLCVEHLLVVEIDGGGHVWQKQSDAKRDLFLQSKGLHVLRIDASLVKNEMDFVLEKILRTIGMYPSDPPSPSPSPSREREVLIQR